MWTYWKMEPMQARQVLRRLSGTSDPAFSLNTLGGIADSLRTLGNLEQLQKAACRELLAKGSVPDSHPFRGDQLPQDAFDLWELNYRSFGLESMAKRIKWLSQVFNFLIDKGFAGQGLRLLDHGVCGGLIQLLYVTNFFCTYFGLDGIVTTNEYENSIITRFKNEAVSKNVHTRAYWWWSGIVWASASCAVHNILQIDTDKIPKELRSGKPLTLEEDPLAYLGILVDCIQEWDRYTTSQESVICGVCPLQGVDVLLSNKNDVIILSLPERFAAEAEKGLNRSLEDWKRFLKIRHRRAALGR